MNRHTALLFVLLTAACAPTARPSPIEPTASAVSVEITATEAATSIPTVTSAPTSTTVPTPTVQGGATLEALYTQIPGPLPDPTRSGGLAEPASFEFHPVNGATVESLKAQASQLLELFAQKTGPDMPADFESKIRALMLPRGSLENVGTAEPCDVDDAVKFFTPDLNPSFGPPYSLWLDGIDSKSIVWNFGGNASDSNPTVTVTYDGRRDVLYAVIGVNVPTAHLMVFTYPKETTEQDNREIRGAVYFKLVDGQWRIALTSVGCQYKIQ